MKHNYECRMKLKVIRSKWKNRYRIKNTRYMIQDTNTYTYGRFLKMKVWSNFGFKFFL